MPAVGCLVGRVASLGVGHLRPDSCEPKSDTQTSEPNQITQTRPVNFDPNPPVDFGPDPLIAAIDCDVDSEPELPHPPPLDRIAPARAARAHRPDPPRPARANRGGRPP
ncbi:hypothetical protein GQ457_02G025130 [Hibiscus cannabinus]